MTSPRPAPPDGERLFLGRDSGLSYYAIGNAVWSFDGVYWRDVLLTAARWETSPPARRIAERIRASERARRRYQALPPRPLWGYRRALPRQEVR